MSETAVLATRDLGYSIGQAEIIKPTSVAFRPGGFNALIGQSGAGKSTLLRLLSGELAPSSGKVLLHGEPVGDMLPRRLAGLRAVLPQASRIAFPFSAAEIVRLGLETGVSGVARERWPALVSHMLAEVGLRGYESRQYNTLSGGEQQRVQLARVLVQVHEPKAHGLSRLLFLDEPTSSLDLRHQIEILDLARAYADGGGTVLAVLHDINLAARYADRLIAIEEGHIIYDGSPQEVVRPERIDRLFGISACVNRTPANGQPFVLPYKNDGMAKKACA